MEMGKNVINNNNFTKLKRQKMTHSYQFQYVTFYFLKTVDDIKIFGTQV